MKGRVLRPIPGTGYGIGELASFDDERAEKYKEFLKDKNYFEEVSDDEPEDEIAPRTKNRQYHRAGDPDPISKPEPAPKPAARRDDEDEVEDDEVEVEETDAEDDAETGDEGKRKAPADEDSEEGDGEEKRKAPAKAPAKTGKQKATAPKAETATK